jgi:hypothetical protein
VASPHYVRFARALVLAGMTSSCGQASTIGPPDAGTDASFNCASCSCVDLVDDTDLPDGGLPQCLGIRHVVCGCAAVGPLAPPDLGRDAV